MRFIRVGARVCVATLPFFLMACVGDDNASPGPTTDSGTQPAVDGSPGFDATVGDSAASDSGQDTGADTGVDAGPQPVVLTVLDTRGAPEPNKMVVFHDSTGAVIDSATTNATGQVSKLLASGSAITALLGGGSTVSAITIFGVEPGDVLTTIDTTNIPVSLNVTVDSYPPSPPGGALGFTVQAGQCTGSGGAPVLIGLGADCLNAAGGFPLLAVATNDSNAEVGYAFTKPAPSDGGVDDAGQTHTTMAGTTWSTTAPAAQTFTATNIPTEDGGAGFGTDFLTFSEVASGVKLPFQSTFSNTQPQDGGMASLATSAHVGYADFVQTEVSSQFFPSTGNYSMVTSIATRAATPTSAQSYTTDFSQALPWISSPVLDTTDAGTVSQPSVTWTTAGSLASTDGAIVGTQWYAVVDGGSVAGSWTFVLPPTTTSFKAPALPASASAWVPPANASFSNPPFIVFLEGSFLTGYRDLRAGSASFGVAHGAASGGFAPPLPADGTLRFTGIASGD